MTNLVLTMTNGEVTTTSRQVAEVFGKDHDKVRRDIEVIMESQSPDLAIETLFTKTTYVSERGREYPQYTMNRDGWSLLVMGFTGKSAMQWKLKYIAAFNEMEEKLKNSFAIPKSYAQALLLASQQAQVIEEQTLAIAHKSQVIQGLTQEIPLADKRQILNRVVRKVSNYQLRWTELYRQFELKFHMNINKRMEGYNANHKPKVKSKIDYIDEVLDQLDDLYDIACKLYESDVNSLVAEMYNLGEPA